MPTTAPVQRTTQRHNQISIRLHCALGDAWVLVEAQHWNARGFCFFHAQALDSGAIALKRSLQHFQGELLWSRPCQERAPVLEMLMNEAIHQHAQHLQQQPDTRQRLLRLMRVDGMAQAKQRVLDALGSKVSDEEWQRRVNQRLQTPLFQSGVRVDSPVWNGVVADALALGSVVQDLERWSGTLTGS